MMATTFLIIEASGRNWVPWPDFERFAKEVHNAGMRIITDLVLSHTSSVHPWFVEARSSRDNQKSKILVSRTGSSKSV